MNLLLIKIITKNQHIGKKIKTLDKNQELEIIYFPYPKPAMQQKYFCSYQSLYQRVQDYQYHLPLCVVHQT